MPPDFLLRLKWGSTPWNHWRLENPDVTIVLDGAVLNGMILTGVNFSGVSLRRASLHATNLMNADLRGADLTNANLVEADLIGAQLHGAVLTGANLHEADLLGADIGNARCSLDDLKGALHVVYPFEVRRIESSDVDAMAAAHIDSIQSIGPRFYPPDVVSDWSRRIKGRGYLDAMATGEEFFIAVASGRGEVLGFSAHYMNQGQHGVAVYVRGSAARRGIGSSLLKTAEEAAIAAGAFSVSIDASLAAVDFYKVNGFVEIGRGEHRLDSGRTMACVFMRKELRVGIE